jgi:hypothetical protein
MKEESKRTDLNNKQLFFFLETIKLKPTSTAKIVLPVSPLELPLHNKEHCLMNLLLIIVRDESGTDTGMKTKERAYKSVCHGETLLHEYIKDSTL